MRNLTANPCPASLELVRRRDHAAGYMDCATGIPSIGLISDDYRRGWMERYVETLVAVNADGDDFTLDMDCRR